MIRPMAPMSKHVRLPSCAVAVLLFSCFDALALWGCMSLDWSDEDLSSTAAMSTVYCEGSALYKSATGIRKLRPQSQQAGVL